MNPISYPPGKNKNVVIVEIGNDWLKIVEGRVSRSGIQVTRSTFKKMAQIKEQVSEGIVKVWEEMKFSKSNVISYVSRQLITVRVLELPSTNLAEISQMINLQIGKQTPYSKEEIVYAYQVIDSFKEGYTKVMLAIAKRNIINERMDILKKAGIHPQKMAFSSEGIYHWFKAFHLGHLKNDSAQSVIVIDIDSNYSDFLLIHQGKMAFTKNILIGANHLSEGHGDYREKFIDELVHSKEICQEEWRGIAPSKAFLSGAIKDVSALTAQLSARLDVPCEIIDGGKDADVKNADPISVSAVFGFMIKQQEVTFNLIPGEMRIQRLMEGKRKDLTVVGVLLGAIIMMLSLLVFIHVDQKNSYLAQIKDKLAAIKGDSDEVDKLRTYVNLARERMDAGGDCLNILNEIYEVLPPKIYLTSISIERKGQIVFRGRSMAMSEVFKFVNTLEGVPDLKNVQNTYATSNKENDSDYDTDFEITAVYNDKS